MSETNQNLRKSVKRSVLASERTKHLRVAAPQRDRELRQQLCKSRIAPLADAAA